MSTTLTYRIDQGVRRAKVSLLAGRTTIMAHVYSKDGVLLDTRELPIESLRSPKDVIDLTVSAVEWTRYLLLENLAFRGLPMPTIIVHEGGGVPIADVRLIR